MGQNQMKVLSRPKSLGKLTFNCKSCHTQFVASPGEYTQQISPKYEKKSGINLFNTYIATPS